ncbi:hypothetical protein ACOXXX_07400 [Thalassococcus sp. BH17M4-6]|uniref:hypothetical protein n=1 Tax=Thalassococcus sp. BH17M4-6 TaxID=3413148 RepID=UPI003BE4D84D
MRLGTIRELAALILIAGHLLAVALIFGRLHDWANSTERLELVLILSPLTGLFALAGVRHILGTERRRRSTAKVTAAFGIVAVGLPLIFCGFILYTIWVFPYGVAADLDSLRLTLAASEAGLGALIGAVAEKLFGADMAALRDEVEASHRSQ